MKQLQFPLCALAALLLTACAGNSGTPRLQTAQDTLSWAMGENIAGTLQEMAGTLQLDNRMVMQAIQHTLDGKAQPLDDSTYNEALQTLAFNQQVAMMQKANQMESEVNARQEQFFAELVKEHPSVQKHESGFYYEQLQAGKGRNARFGDRISFDYRSYVMFTGEPYDQTYGKRDPILHTVGRPMFQGLIDAMQLMNEGSIYRFYFPYQLAFGTGGSGDIPGYTPFIYEVELHEIFTK